MSQSKGYYPVAVLTLCMTLVAVCTKAQVVEQSHGAAMKEFSEHAQAYIRDERKLPADKLKPTTDMALLEKQRIALRAALQQSRADAKQGDMFDEAAAKVFRNLIAQAMTGPDGSKIRSSMNHAEPAAPAVFKVNAPYPNAGGQPIQSVPPSLLQQFPILPKGLEYCIAGKTLALRDTDANMVVDFLPNALP